jgi:outer membrane protein assembly factor BamA
MRCSLLIILLLTIPALADAQRIYLKQVVIEGNNRTRRSIILREMSIDEGLTYPADSAAALIEVNRLRLLNSTLFTTVSITQNVLVPIVPRSTNVPDTAIWIINVKERWYIIPKPLFQLADRNFNVWWEEMNRDPKRANFGLTLTDNNFRGNMERISATAQVGYTQRFALEYARPYLDNAQQHGIGLSLSASQSGELAYTTDLNKLKFARLPGSRIIRQYAAAVSYTYRPAFAVRHLLELSYHTVQIADTVLSLNSFFFKNGAKDLRYGALLYRLDINYTDNWNYPLRGFKMVSYALARLGFRGADFQGQLRTETGLYHNPLRKWYTSVIFRGRLSLPEDQPYYFRTALGTKTDYVRGYELYVMDGAHYGVLRLNLKREILNKTLFMLPFKYLPSLPLRLYPKVFADAGYVHDKYPGNSRLSNRLLYSAGIGIDAVTAYDVKVRVEFARNSLGENGVFLHLNAE